MRIGSTAINLEKVIAIEFDECAAGCLLTFETEHTVKQVMVPNATEEETMTAMMTRINKPEHFNSTHFDLMVAISAVRRERKERIQ
jgi:hypothetical protein